MDQFECIEVSKADDVSVVRFTDEKVLDPARVQKLGDELLSLPETADHRNVLINLDNVRFLSSAAINKLIVLEKRIKSAGGRIKLSNLRPEVQEVFNITHLNSVFDIQDEQADAIQSFQSDH